MLPPSPSLAIHYYKGKAKNLSYNWYSKNFVMVSNQTRKNWLLITLLKHLQDSIS